MNSGIFAPSFIPLSGTPRDIIPHLETVFHAVGIPAARAEAEGLMAGLLKLRRTELYLAQTPLTEEIAECLEEWVARRLAGEPVHYVTGAVEFCGHELTVTPAVLIPRPETEVLVSAAIERLRMWPSQSSEIRILELGTGSGAIAISLAEAISACHVVAVELSWDALAVARTNIARHHLDGRIGLVHADWTSGVRGPFQMVIANPPYVTTDEVDQLMPPRDHEPRMSLDGGVDGMQFYRVLWADVTRVLASGGWLGVECAEDQAAVLQHEAKSLPWVRTATMFEDLTGRPRGLWIERV